MLQAQLQRVAKPTASSVKGIPSLARSSVRCARPSAVRPVFGGAVIRAGTALAAHGTSHVAAQHAEEVVEEAVAESQAEDEEGEEGQEVVGEGEVPEAVAEQAQPEIELVTEEYTEEVEEVIKPLTIQGVAQDTVHYLRNTNPGKVIAVTGALVLAGTFVLACMRYYKKFTSARSQRQRQVNKNKLLAQELSKVLPSNRAKLNASYIATLRMRTGFTNVEIFRKYLWYLLRERKFDQAAVEDMVALKHASGMKDTDVAEAVRERAQRIYDKYGTLMLNTEGFTAQGIERKATCRNLFRKLMYLTEHDPLLRQGTDAALMVDLRKIMGATDEDMDKLRIVSLYDVDLEKAFNMQVSEDESDREDAAGAVVDVAPEETSATDGGSAGSTQQGQPQKPGDSKA